MDIPQWVNEFEKIELDHSGNLVNYLPWKTLVPKCEKWYVNNDELYSESFLNYVDNIDPKNPIFVSNQCNLWNGTININKGYARGRYQDGRTIMEAYRYMYILRYGGIPKNKGIEDNDICPCQEGIEKKRKYKDCCKPVVRHRCIQFTGENHQGLCVNPFHLYIGTSLHNRHDVLVDKTGKGKVMKGAEHPNAKITDDVAREIWTDIESGMKLEDVANKHDVSLHIVKDMSASKTWTHITGKSNAKMLENRKIEKDKKFYKQCIARKDTMESKGFHFCGEIPPKPEEAPKPTTKICRGIICIQIDPNGMELPLECFGWKSSDHIQRRSECIQCKNESLRKYRCRKEEREYIMKIPNHIASNVIDTTKMKCCAGEYCRSKYSEGNPQPLENFPQVKGKPYAYCKLCKQMKDKQSYERRKKSTINEKEQMSNEPDETLIKLNCPVGFKYCKTCKDYLPIEQFPGSNAKTKWVQIIMDCTECRKMNAKKSKAEAYERSKKRKAALTGEEPEKKKSKKE